MKNLILVIRPEKLERVKQVIDACGCHGMTITSVMGCGAQKGMTDGSTVYKGMKTNINLLPKIMVMAVIADENIQEVTLQLQDAIRTGEVGDGKIFITPVEDVIRIRTGEHGDEAL